MKNMFVFALALVFLSGLAYSQSIGTGAIEGRVTDEQGTPLPGAEVKLTSPDMIGGAQSKITDAEGKFRFIALLPGMYAVEASLQGFTPSKKENIRLHIGQTLIVEIQLRIGTLEEEVTVQAVAPIVDVKDSAVAVQAVGKDFIDTVPEYRRRIGYLVDVTPGSVGYAVYGGASRSGNQSLVDGINIGAANSGADWSMFDYYLVSDLEIQGLGASAEYDGFDGVIMNAVTKSGGNRLEGHVEAFYRNYPWTSTSHIDVSKPLYSLYTKPPESMNYDYGASLGGPIIKDKIWFLASARFEDTLTKIVGMTDKSDLEAPKADIKITTQLIPSDRLSGMFIYDDYYNRRSGLSITTPPDATFVEWGPMYQLNINELHTFSDRTFLETKFGAFWVPYEHRPVKGYDISGRQDALTGKYSTNTNRYTRTQLDRFEVSSTITHHADEFIKGSHDFKFGVDFQWAPSFTDNGYTNEFFYRDNVLAGGKFHTYAYSYDTRDEFNFAALSGFAQDSWKISDRLTINPGIRINSFRGYIKTLNAWAFKTTAIVPRIGLTFDVFGDHSTALKLHWGKYASGMKHNYYSRGGAGAQDYVKYDVVPPPNGKKIEVYREGRSNPATIDPDVKYPVMDQFVVGIERALTPDMSVGVSFVYRNWKNFIERVNTGGTWVKVPVTYKDENGVTQTIGLYQKTSKSAADKFYLTNPEAGKYNSVIEDPRSRYLGLVFTFNKRMSNKWMLNASYVLCQLKGTEQGGSSNVNLWLDPNAQVNSYGYLGNDPTHQLKIYSSFFLPLDISAGVAFNYIRGGPWTRQVQAPTTIPGRPTVYIEERGLQRYAPDKRFDIRFEKYFKLGKTEAQRVGVLFDVFNVFNSGRATGVESRVDRTTFGKATGVNTGRQFRIAARILF
jgi:hypothetical protein